MAVALVVLLASIGFYVVPLLFKKAAHAIPAPLMHKTADESLETHEHKRLLSWLHRRWRSTRSTSESNPNSRPVSFYASSNPLEAFEDVSAPYIKSPPQIFTSTLHSSKSLSAQTQVYDHYFSPIPFVPNTPPLQLPTISSDALKSVWESNSSLATEGPVLPPKIPTTVDFRTRSPAVMPVGRIETYIQGSRVRDSLDFDVQSTRKLVMDNRF